MDLPTVTIILLVSGAGVHASEAGRCAAGFELLHNPYIERSAKRAIAEGLREAGCLGRTPRLRPRRGPRRPSDDEPPG